VSHPELSTPHVFRAPRLALASELVKSLDLSGLDEVVESEGFHKVAQTAALTDDMAALIGATWHHPTLELETPAKADGQTWAAYGAAVSNELHEEGYTLVQVLALAVPVYAHTLNTLLAIRTGEQRAAGFPEGAAPSTSSS
jgi:hypothetical protein